MEKPLVSVIMPVYNHEKYVQSAIESIINQTYQNIELLILDDGSKDNSYQKVLEMREKCENRFKRIVMDTKENEGTCETYNKLFALSQGEFVYLIASDDISKPNAIELEVDFLLQNPNYGLAVGNNEIIDENGCVTYRDINGETVYEKADADYLSSTDIMQEAKNIKFNSELFGTYATLFFVGNYIPNGYTIRKSILEKAGGFTKEAPLEDYYEMLQLSKYCKFKYIDEILFSYRLHGSNTTTQGKKMRDMARKTFKHELEILKKADFSNMLPEVQKTYKLHKIFGKLAKFAKKTELYLKYKF